MEKCQIPAFESWHYCEAVIHAGLTQASYFGDEDLFKLPVAMPVNSAYLNGGHYYNKARKRNGFVVEKQCSSEQMQKKQENACDFAVGTLRSRVPKAVDEDLYKIPQELLYQKPKRKRLLMNLLSGCLGLSCIP